MITPLSAEKIKQFFKLEFATSPNLSQIGGAQVFVEFLRKIQFRERLDAVVGPRKANAIVQIMLGVFAGGDSMKAIARISQDSSLKGYLGKPVGDTQLTRILQEMPPSEIQALHEFSISLGLLDIADGAFKGIPMTLDFDATSREKFGSQEGVEVGYLEKDTLAPCYQYLLVRNDHLNSLLYGTIRGGAAHSQNNFCGYLKMILPLFSGQWSLRIRADSGFFNEEAFDLCVENKVIYYIKAPMISSRVSQSGSSAIKWIQDESNADIEYGIYDTASKKGYQWREVFKRTKCETKEGELLSEYFTQCIATNDFNKSPADTFSFYNGRARIENTNLEMKDDYFLGDIVTQWFGVNDVITQAQIMLYQLVSHFKRHCMDKVFQPMRLSTLRTQIFNVPGRILSSGRRTWTRVYNRFHAVLVYSRILARILGLRTILSLAPRLNTG